jgi:hypothetical protein
LRKLVVLLLVVVTGWYLTLGGGLRRYEEYRVRGALIESGLSEKRADCMARRMVKRLSILQLWKLQSFAEERRTLGAYMRGVKRVGDAEAVAVTISSAALCAAGVG